MNDAIQPFALAVYDTVHENPNDVPPKAIADALGVTHGYLLAAANPNLPHVSLQARHIAQITRVTGSDAILRSICEDAGYFCIAKTRITTGATDVLTAAGTLARESGESLLLIASAMADGAISEHDAVLTRSELNELIRAAEAVKELLAQKVGA